MKLYVLVAVIGVVLAVGFAVPFGDDDLGTQDNELRDIADGLGDDFEQEDLKSDYEMDREDEEDDEDDFDDEDDNDRDEDEEEGEVDNDEGNTAIERSSDPIKVGFRIFRTAGRIIRHVPRKVGRIGGRVVRTVGRKVRHIEHKVGRVLRG